jgi:hypothetical protein
MIVDTKIHSKPQAILRLLVTNNLSKRIKDLKSVNNSNYFPIDVA